MATLLVVMDGDSDSGSDNSTTISSVTKVWDIIEDFKGAVEPETCLTAVLEDALAVTKPSNIAEKTEASAEESKENELCFNFHEGLEVELIEGRGRLQRFIQKTKRWRIKTYIGTQIVKKTEDELMKETQREALNIEVDSACIRTGASKDSDFLCTLPKGYYVEKIARKMVGTTLRAQIVFHYNSERIVGWCSDFVLRRDVVSIMVHPGRLGLKGRGDGSIKHVAFSVQKPLFEAGINCDSQILRIDGAEFSSKLLIESAQGSRPYELEIYIPEEYDPNFELEDNEYDIFAEKFETNFYNQFSCEKLQNKRSKTIRKIKAKYTKKPSDASRRSKRKARTEFHRQHISPVADSTFFVNRTIEHVKFYSLRANVKSLVDRLIRGIFRNREQQNKEIEQIAKSLVVENLKERQKLVKIFFKQFERLIQEFGKDSQVGLEVQHMVDSLTYELKECEKPRPKPLNGWVPQRRRWTWESIRSTIRYPIEFLERQLTKASTCSLCCDDDKDLKLVKTGCHEGCHMCIDCVKGFLKSSAERGKTQLRCPGMHCGSGIDEPEKVFGKVAPKAWKLFKESIWKNKLRTCENFRYCPNEKCGAGFEMPSRCCHMKSISCPECDYTFCPQCYGPDHSEIGTCMEFLALCQGKSMAEVTIENTKQCPFCLVWIEKNDGCSHMTCDHCNGEFCWLCMGDWKLHGYNDCPKHTKFTVERPTFEQLIPTKPLGFYKLIRDAKLRVQARMESFQVNILPKDAVVKVVAFRGNRCQIEYGHNGAHWCTVRTAIGPLLKICESQTKAKVEYEKNLMHGYMEYYRDPSLLPAEMRLFEEERFRDVAQIFVVDYDPWNNPDEEQNFHRGMGIKYCFTDEPELVKPPQCEAISEKFETKQLKKRERTNLAFRHNYNKKNKLSSKDKNVNEGKNQKRRRKVNHFRKHRSEQQQFNSEKTSSNTKQFEQKRRVRKQSCRTETDMSLLEETNNLMFVYV